MSLLAISLFSSLALAGRTLVRRDDGNIPWNSNDDFEEWIESGNASTIREIKIPNIHDSEFPGDGEEADYVAFVRINEEGENSVAKVDLGFRPDEKYINDNGSLNAEDDHWIYCLDFNVFDAPKDLGDDDVEADCSNVFEDDCLDWLSEFAKDGKFCYNTHDPWKDSPCEGVLGNNDSDVFADTVPLIPVGPSNFSTAGNFTEPDEEDQYDYSVTRIYMLAIGFARNEWTNENGDFSIDPEALEDDSWEYAPAKVVCLRADEFSEDSRTLKDIQDDEDGDDGDDGDDDDGLGVAVNARVAWCIIAAAAAMMLSGSI